MIADISTVSRFEASIILFQRLGLLRVWPDFLADNARDRQHVNGITLSPCCKQRDSNANRPRYAVEDIAKFINDVKASDPTAGPEEIRAVRLPVDRKRHWCVNRFDRAGNPTLKHRIWAGAGRRKVH